MNLISAGNQEAQAADCFDNDFYEDDLGIENENAHTVRMPHFGMESLQEDIQLSRIQRLDQINMDKNTIMRQEPFSQILVNAGGQSADMDHESVVDMNIQQTEQPRKRAFS